jgi:hypothetical protein
MDVLLAVVAVVAEVELLTVGEVAKRPVGV